MSRRKYGTPIRYTGGKKNSLKTLDQYFIKDYTHYREPFIGGGSVFLYLKQFQPDASYWINDIYHNLYCFWITLRDHGQEMHSFITKLRQDHPNPETCKSLFSEVKEQIPHVDIFTKGCYFFILNKTSYSGLTEQGTFSPQASVSNFSQSCIDYLLEVSPMLANVKITNLDYTELFKDVPDNTFTFLDSPYDILNKSKNNALYGKNGEHHKSFDHIKFYEDVKELKGKWMITYNYSDVLLERWKDYYCLEWKLKYGMQWEKDENGINKAKEKSELLVMNY